MRAFFLLLSVATTVFVATQTARAGDRANRVGLRFSRTMSWHGPYYHTQTGYPLGLVVPPIAEMQTKMAWGVSQDEMVPIYHQVQRGYPGDYGGPTYSLMPTPHWPSHTDQFGVYYIRGPW